MTSIFRPVFRRKISIKGPCLFLVGPIGTFFARLSNYLEKNNCKTYKISFPLHEFGFRKSKLINYSKDIDLFKDFLRKTIMDKKIKHIFMYGNVLLPHRYALEVANEINTQSKKIETHIFELGYLRPNFVTLESKGVNYSSDFLLSNKFYKSQDTYKVFPKSESRCAPETSNLYSNSGWFLTALKIGNCRPYSALLPVNIAITLLSI